jgi:hypothetical protein
MSPLDNAPERWEARGMLEELHFGTRTRGRAAKPLNAVATRDLRESDLALLSSERGIKPPAIKELRDRHHALARALASGMRDSDASAITGYSPSRISILKADPAFADLLQSYQENSSAVHADFVDRATVLGLTVVNELQDRLETDEVAEMTPAQLLEIGKFAADRAGFAPVNRSVNLNANVDISRSIDAARRRLTALPTPPESIPSFGEVDFEAES